GLCPDKYKRYSLQHSFCLPTCVSCAFYSKDVRYWLKNYILYQHNNLRNVVASGRSYGVDHVPRICLTVVTRIGCGYLFRKYTNVICNYGPRGNVEGEEIYKGGDICSACPANTCCGDGCKYHGLCKFGEPNLPEIFYCGFNGESDCR
uniref:CRISP-1 (Fragments) n=1 Tax=Phoneutria keyserlingi TaxID=272754 RepID=VA_PHOKE|nr:RecName: Full=CRISP-1; AltName: Full=Cysteine-rich venom protein; Short=CRVP; AltName: Full=Venom allergen [Phoneutria keyserlingi]